MTPRELSAALIDAYNRRDIEGIAALIADDVSYTRMGGVVVPTKDDVVAGYAATFEADITFEVVRSTQEGDAVVVELEGRQLTPPHREIRANDFHRWRNGQLVEYRAFVDVIDG